MAQDKSVEEVKQDVVGDLVEAMSSSDVQSNHRTVMPPLEPAATFVTDHSALTLLADAETNQPRDDEFNDEMMISASLSHALNSSSHNGFKKPAVAHSPLQSSVSQFDYDLNSVGSYFQGEPLTNGFLLNKINPVFDPDFMYLNRNKLVNRRLALRKRVSNSICELAPPLVPSYTPHHHEPTTPNNNSKSANLLDGLADFVGMGELRSANREFTTPIRR